MMKESRMELKNEKFLKRHIDYSIEQKVWSVIWYSKHGKPKPVQIKYRRKFGRHARTPDGATIKQWWTEIFETGSVNKRKKSGKEGSTRPGSASSNRDG
uniref:DUF4817 domain-containing protein n=1 Tax=Ditylenchus dipsaci TaxID=166011 RepID=A0A915DWK3_9BILA